MQPDRHAHPELAARTDAESDHGREPEPDQLDLLSIGLAVFFIALIAIVAAMLVLSRLISGG